MKEEKKRKKREWRNGRKEQERGKGTMEVSRNKGGAGSWDNMFSLPLHIPIYSRQRENVFSPIIGRGLA